MTVTREVWRSGATLVLSCDVCKRTMMFPNKGLGRASAAAWETRHQHLTEEES